MADLTSKYLRIFSVEVDRQGIDPLKDKLIPLITQIQKYTTHSITQDERASPDLISLREYGTDELWWMIMAYNGVGSYRELVEGRSLKVPDFASIVSIVTSNAVRPNKIQRVITI